MRVATLLPLAAALFVAVPTTTHLGVREAAASVAVEMTLADVLARADRVVVATPLDTRSVWEREDGARSLRIATYTRLRVERSLDGAPSAEVWVRTLGGRVDSIGQHVDGEATFVQGESVLLFLRSRTDGTHVVIGRAQGELRVVDVAGARHLLPPAAPGVLLPPNGGPVLPAIHAALSGKTLDEAASLIARERAAHAH